MSEQGADLFSYNLIQHLMKCQSSHVALSTHFRLLLSKVTSAKSFQRTLSSWNAAPGVPLLWHHWALTFRILASSRVCVVPVVLQGSFISHWNRSFLLFQGWVQNENFWEMCSLEPLLILYKWNHPRWSPSSPFWLPFCSCISHGRRKYYSWIFS